MVVIRNKLATSRSAGPRQFAQIRDRFLVAAESQGDKGKVRSELDSLGMEAREISSAPVIIASAESTFEQVMENLSSDVKDVREATGEVAEARKNNDGVVESTTATIRATDELLRELGDLASVRQVDFVNTFVDFGPEQLNFSPDEMGDVLEPEQEKATQQEVLEALGIPEAWETTRGEGAAIAVFDTGFAEGLIGRGRVRGTFHGEKVDSAYEASEGHGSMTVGAAAANSDEGVPFDGVAPDADVYLARITGPDGQIRSDLIVEAWDWINNQSIDKPLVSNHSYGTPLCSSLQRSSVCNDSLAETIKLSVSDSDHTAVYAAGNEAGYCGHRPSGITNGITGHNSLANVVTVGAILTNGRTAQRYSSHGRGDCSPRADPKPNVSCRIPRKTYYGDDSGWTVKDMSTGIFGSSGGTSCASPMITGMIALLQSANQSDPLQTEEVKRVIQENSELPHATLPNQFGFAVTEKGHDARFGFGQFDITSAIAGE